MQRYRYIVSKRGRNVNDCFYLLRGGAPRPHALRVRFFCGVAPAGLLGVALFAGWPPPGLWALPFLRLAARWGFGRCLFLRGGPRRGLGLHSCGSSSAKQGGGYAPPHPAPTLSGKSRQKAAARRLRQKPLNAGLGRGDAQSALFVRELGLPWGLVLCGVRPDPRPKPAGVFACACYCRSCAFGSGFRSLALRARVGKGAAFWHDCLALRA